MAMAASGAAASAPYPPAGAGRSSDWAFKRLFQLESECRSSTPAVQVEAIGEFPKLLDLFPFPMLVSSAFLKLGDLFRNSPNSLRHHIAQVFEASQHHLAQIAHTEELLKRILVVLYSNDPIARVLALRLIGNASSVFARFPEAQHGTLLRYQSSHPLEIAAAVQTTERMLEFSPGFLGVVWETVQSKADSAQVPDSVRVQLIRSLRHAAPSLQLSTLLYSRCRSWAERPDSTAVVQCAALDTWRSTIQSHNELAADDADFVSGFVAHALASVRRSALALLGRWHPTTQVAEVDAGRLAGVKARLCAHLGAQLGEDMVPDLSELRPATTTLARIETACPPTGPRQSWLFAMTIVEQALRSFGEALRATADTGAQHEPWACTTRMGDAGASHHYRHLASSVMLAVSAATILGGADAKSRAAGAIRDAWLAMSEACEAPGEAAYVRRFLRISWAWCKSMGMELTVAAALPALLDARSCSVACKIAAIASSPRHFGLVSAECVRHVSGFVSALESGNANSHAPTAAWNSMLVILARDRRPTAAKSLDMGVEDMGAEDMGVEDIGDLATTAISKWSAYLCNHAEEPAVCVRAFANTGPPVWAVRPMLALLAAGGRWSTVDQLCQALLSCGIGGRLQSQLYALSALARAEASTGDTEAFLRAADIALNALRALDNQSSKCTFRLFLIQLRRELVSLSSEWRQLQAPATCGPAAAFIARSLIERTRALAVQADFVHDVFPSADSATRRWLVGVRAALQHAQTLLGASSAVQPDGRTTADIALAAIGSVGATFTPGPALLCEPQAPTLCFETRPNLGGDGSALAVLSGSQLHFVVEGFLRQPRNPRSAAYTHARVAVWLSRRPRGAADQDLAASAEYCAVAQRARPSALNSAPAESAGGDDEGPATAFEAALDGAYFKCLCTVATPSLRAMLGHTDANAMYHVHVYCGLADPAGRVRWTGPHSSYPLLVSTTARS